MGLASVQASYEPQLLEGLIEFWGLVQSMERINAPISPRNEGSEEAFWRSDAMLITRPILLLSGPVRSLRS